jgi:hypothetical protein
MTIRQIIEFGPEYSSWEDWNGNMLHYFGEEAIMYSSEDNWQQVAYNIMSLSTFSNYAISDPAEFEDWKDWVYSFIETVNGPTQ